MEERIELMELWETGLYSMTELSERYGVSRKTVYKWVGRYEGEGREGLEDRSRAPRHCPHRTPEGIAELIVGMRVRHRRWGPKKIVRELARLEPGLRMPAVSTAGAMLKRAGLVVERVRRRRWPGPERPVRRASEANELWTVDFKGQFRLGDGSLCYPLTIQDAFSRYVVACRGLESVASCGVRASMERVFRECGLPVAIRTDNGGPFASRGIRGLTRLNVWWIHLGIAPERIQKGHPEQNGAHERMHRELKAATARPPAPSPRAQQRRFDRFSQEYNVERPHEGIGQRRPAELWQPSRRPYPQVLRDPDYSSHVEVRRVHHAGEITFNNRRIFLSKALAGHLVGLEPVDDGVWSILFNTVLIGRLSERDLVVS